MSDRYRVRFEVYEASDGIGVVHNTLYRIEDTELQALSDIVEETDEVTRLRHRRLGIEAGLNSDRDRAIADATWLNKGTDPNIPGDEDDLAARLKELDFQPVDEYRIADNVIEWGYLQR